MTEGFDFDNAPVTDGPVPNHKASEGDPFDVPVTEGPSNTGLFRLSGKRTTKESTKPRTQRAKKPPPENRPGQYVDQMEDLYNGLAFVMMPIRPPVAMALMSPCAPPSKEQPEPPTVARNCALKWDELAQKNESVRRFLDGFLTVGVWGALFAAHVPLIVAGMQGTPLEERFNPAAAMEAFLKRQAEEEPNVSD